MIYLIRHGEAAASWGAHPDPGLSEAGHAQARAVAIDLSELGIQNVITSPMARCQETASAFSTRSGLAAVITPSVTEIPTPPSIDDRVSWLRALMSGKWDTAPELVQDWRNGLIETVSALPEHTAIFTHFVAINAIAGHLDGDDNVTVFRPNYCSVTTLARTTNGLRLVKRGDSLETKIL